MANVLPDFENLTNSASAPMMYPESRNKSQRQTEREEETKLVSSCELLRPPPPLDAQPSHMHSPNPKPRLLAPRPLIKSHILNVPSFPTLNATFPLGCTSTELTRPVWPLSVRRGTQSRVLKTVMVASSEVERRWEGEGNVREVMVPTNKADGKIGV
jgi:hypothetical protein